MFGRRGKRRRAPGRKRKASAPPAPADTADPLDDPATIDFVTRHQATGDVALGLVVKRPLGAGDPDRIRAKIDMYRTFLATDQLSASVPGWEETATLILLQLEHPPAAEVVRFLEDLADELDTGAGLGLIATGGRGEAEQTLVQRPGPSGIGPAGALRGGRAFTRYVMARLEAHGREGVERVDYMTVDHGAPGGASGRLHLQNLYQRVKDLGAPALEADVERWISSSRDAGDVVSGQVVPVVRPRAMQGGPDHPASIPAAEDLPEAERVVYAIPFTPHLFIGLVADTEMSMRYLLPSDVASLGLEDADAAMRLAMGNLGRKIGDDIRLYPGEGWYGVACGGDYEASLLLADWFWSEMADRVQGDVVVAVPTRDVLLVTGSDEPGGLAEVKARVRDVLADPQGMVIWDGLLRRSGHGWVEISD